VFLPRTVASLAFTMARRALHCAALLLVLFATTVRGWDCVGHMLTTMIALNLSPDNVRSTYQPLFEAMEARYENLSVAEEVACWPDDARSFTDEYAPWHYQDNCFSPYNSTCGPADGTLFDALERSQVNVRNAALPLANRSFWLAFLVHLVGDAHQPLHLCALFNSTFPRGDLGGNLFSLNYRGRFYHLHTMCDAAADAELSSKFKRPVAADASLLQNMRDVAKQLQARFPVTAAEANSLDRTTWVSEALAICAKDAYLDGKLLNGSTVSEEYVSSLREVLLRRIVVGGTRLATVLANSMPPAALLPATEDPSRGGVFPAFGGAALLAAAALALLLGVGVSAVRRPPGSPRAM
jgi:uncharacterized protein YlxP (DUF503 family)